MLEVQILIRFYLLRKYTSHIEYVHVLKIINEDVLSMSCRQASVKLGSTARQQRAYHELAQT